MQRRAGSSSTGPNGPIPDAVGCLIRPTPILRISLLMLSNQHHSRPITLSFLPARRGFSSWARAALGLK